MTSFAKNLATIGWSTEEFARRIGCNERIAELMVTGDAEVPPEVADWVQALAIFFVNHPAPRWKGFRQDFSFLRNPSQHIFLPFKINALPKGILIEDSPPRKL